MYNIFPSLFVIVWRGLFFNKNVIYWFWQEWLAGGHSSGAELLCIVSVQRCSGGETLVFVYSLIFLLVAKLNRWLVKIYRL